VLGCDLKNVDVIKRACANVHIYKITCGQCLSMYFTFLFGDITLFLYYNLLKVLYWLRKNRHLTSTCFTYVK
jgi:hypothetical protein